MDKEARGSSILGKKEWFRVKDLTEILSLGESTIFKWIKEGNFPQPKKITPNFSVFLREDVEAWMHKKTKGVDEGNLQELVDAIRED
tara:strand:- start:443 stop:703 length:261 start_codon:yes stop_codon:yes gene_type:complete